MRSEEAPSEEGGASVWNHADERDGETAIELEDGEPSEHGRRGRSAGGGRQRSWTFVVYLTHSGEKGELRVCAGRAMRAVCCVRHADADDL